MAAASNNARLHSAYAHPVTRQWQSLPSALTPTNLMYPLFIIDNPNEEQKIDAMPGVSRFGINKALEHLEELLPLGLSSVLLFSVTDLPKDDVGSAAMSEDNPIYNAIRMIKEKYGDKLLVAVDVCLCPYTSHGHCGVFYDTCQGKSCGVLDDNMEINNAKTIELLANLAGKLAEAGADVVAPSDMMDGRVGAIKDKLRQLALDGKVSVLSYSSKFASSFYGPFRQAAHSAPQFGDRKRYQLPIGSRGLAVQAADRDVRQGADMLMVKPGLAYLDLVREIKERHPYHPMFVYQVSGEYAMLLAGSKVGAFDEKAIINEVMTSMRRAGADVIITYFTPKLLQWMKST